MKLKITTLVIVEEGQVQDIYRITKIRLTKNL